MADKEAKEAALAAKNRILPAKETALFKTLLVSRNAAAFQSASDRTASGSLATIRIEAVQKGNQGSRSDSQEGAKPWRYVLLGTRATSSCSTAPLAETLALKALILHSSLPHNHPTASSQPKGEEVDHLIEAALRKDPYSHITHHVNSIIARANKDYDTACRSLNRARDIDRDNMPLMRDAISLHTQLGQHKESLRVRHKYFTMRPNLRSHWISLAVGHELCGNDQEALSVFLGLEEAPR